MDNKKLGVIIIAISIIFGLFVYGFGIQASKLQTNPCICGSCQAEKQQDYLIYGSIAVIFSTLSLGLYLLFFEKSNQVLSNKLKVFEKSNRILANKLKKDVVVKSGNEKFKLILMGLNDDEKKVLTAVREQDGITQHTLRLRTDLHKSKLSIILSMLEQKGLVTREQKGKTNQVFLKINLASPETKDED